MGSIFLTEFNRLMQSTDLTARVLGQCPAEWRGFLEFAEAHFRHRDIAHPVIVEIGTYHNIQKVFYVTLLEAEHIGIDADRHAQYDILGNSHLPTTVGKLKERLAGRPIDLLFIDGTHSYRGVKRDYELYAPLTRYLIAFHDCMCDGHPDIEVGQFWRELVAAEKVNSFILFHKPRKHETGTPWDGQDMGIGMMVKE